MKKELKYVPIIGWYITDDPNLYFNMYHLICSVAYNMYVWKIIIES